LKQLKRNIIAEQKGRETEDAAKAKVSGEWPNGQSDWRQTGPGGGGEAVVSHKAPSATECKRKANELDSSNSGGSMEPATRRPSPGP
jgi:hypothetical protein